MKIYDEVVAVKTGRRNDMVDITAEVRGVVGRSGVEKGDCVVFCKHTTGGVTINENADPDVVHDVLLTLDELIPHMRAGYRHCEGNSDSHVKSSLVGCSETVLISGGELVLGTWQGVYFCEFDGPRSRQVVVQVRGE